MNDIILETIGLGKSFETASGPVHALQNVAQKFTRGGCHAIVGESGSGKTTLANLILGLMQKTTGEIVFNNQTLPEHRIKSQRRAIQLVQQNPLSALNPRLSIGASVRLPLDVHDIGPRAGRDKRVADLLEEVGLGAEFATRSPRGLSGGQRQRVAIARALACEPDLIVLDEPTSALDVLVQARVLRLLDNLRRERGLTYLFITHDLAVVRAISTTVSVFQRGRMVESGTVEQIFTNPQADYTRQLIGAVPVVTDDELALRDAIRAGAPY
ncbi:ABC transporter ATP-binding protein [Ketogulonicigenium vulgare]|uniref:Oligopeptide/dipeptide ABC transporter, ATPase subunit n=1 Tax=Ketogulonicigenium vulgare (strain WSH-001) TaxID=759362 RepID=F9YBE7_KETVW|nr:ATP-binding cassette domain-containing protein [Ketogulonicigenium vulgare]AEM42699.1 Oligopeptide/dipeptide ABC transporter, ATPase subunit [Ketogulonicigenium vulgare WSH-001]ALJ82851.1 peptide ABC transporter ATP-binding protein [Ketogulonicigenium vulgare]